MNISDRWQLQADKIMERPGVMHEDDARVDLKFKTFRGSLLMRNRFGD